MQVTPSLGAALRAAISRQREDERAVEEGAAKALIQAAKDAKRVLLDSVGVTMGELVDGDSHCGFTAVANQLATLGIMAPSGASYTQQELRDIVAAYIRENPEAIRAFLVTDRPDEKSPEIYREHIQRDKWLDNIAMYSDPQRQDNF